MKSNQFRVELSENTLQILCEKHVIAENTETPWGNVNANLSRALGWLTRCDCAILTAWRSGKPRKENDDNNREATKAPFLWLWCVKGKGLLHGDWETYVERK